MTTPEPAAEASRMRLTPRLLLVALSAAIVVDAVLSVPREAVFLHQDYYWKRSILSLPSSPIWAPTPEATVESLKLAHPDWHLPEGGRVVSRIPWNLWLGQLSESWLFHLAACWPLCWLLRRRPGWAAASDFTLGLFAVATGYTIAFALDGKDGHWPNPIGFALLGLFLGRAAAAPEGGSPWLGMAAGRRALASVAIGHGLLLMLLTLLSQVLGVRGGDDVAAFASGLGLVLAAYIPALCLSPTGQLRRWTWHVCSSCVILALGGLLDDILWCAVDRSSTGAVSPFAQSVFTQSIGSVIIYPVLVIPAACAVGIFRWSRRRWTPSAP